MKEIIKLENVLGQINIKIYDELYHNCEHCEIIYDNMKCYVVYSKQYMLIVRLCSEGIINDSNFYTKELFYTAINVFSDILQLRDIKEKKYKALLGNNTFEEIYINIYNKDKKLNRYELHENNEFILNFQTNEHMNYYKCFVILDSKQIQLDLFLNQISDNSIKNKYGIYKGSLCDNDYEAVNYLINSYDRLSSTDIFNILMLQQNKKISINDEEYLNELENIEFKYKIVENKLEIFSDEYIVKNKEIIFFKDYKTFYCKMNDLCYSLFKNYGNIDLKYSLPLFTKLIYSKEPLLFDTALEYESNFKINSYFNYDNIIKVKYELYRKGELINVNDLDYDELETYNEFLNVLESLNCVNDKIILLKDIVSFQKTNLSILKCFGEVNVSSNLLNMKITKPTKVQVSAKLEGGLISYELLSELSNEELKQIIDAYEKKIEYVKLKNDTIIELDDSVVELVELVEDLGVDFKKTNKTFTKNISFAFKTQNNLNEEILKIVNEIINFKDFKIKNNDILRDYQKEGVKFLSVLTKHKLGGILADDMGLGKTVQLLTLIKNDKSNKPSIIICPKSLIFNWINEINKWDIGFDAVSISESQLLRKEIISNIKDKKIYVTSYDTLSRDIDLYKKTFRFVVIDEAQYIKNTNTRKANSVKELKAEVKFALTGTPIENSLADLWSIFDFILPGYLSSYNKFKDKYETLILDKDEDALNRFKSKINPFILRRVKKDVLKDLPDKIEEIYYTNLDNNQLELYNAFLNQLKQEIKEESSKIDMLSTITRLRQICVSPKMYLENYKYITPKIEMTIDIIKKAINSNHSILLFSQFVKGLDLISEELKLNNINYYQIDGSTTLKNRKKYVDEFNNSESNNVLLISLKAGGTGLNLTKADIVIHLDPWWNVSAEDQATDRAHRIGQKNVVTVIKVVCSNTIEEKIIELQKVKKDLANKVISNDDTNNLFTLDNIKYLTE